MAEIRISSRHVQRIAAEVGAELAASRDGKAARKRRELPVRVPATPEAVVVEVDGGRLRTRAPGCGPGVHQHQHKEDKIACLATMESKTHEEDPRPEPPQGFQEPRRVQRLVQQMKGFAGDKPQEEDAPPDAPEPEPDAAEDRERPPSPSPRVRTCVASMADSRAFGRMAAAEAQERDFCRAERRAFVADGAAYNWRIQRAHFPDFEPITDFLHALCYVWLAAWGVGKDEEERWAIYLGWLRACWQGRVEEVIEDLRQQQARLGEPPKGEEADAKDPRRLVADALRYLGNNKERMDYPRYRKAGLPVTSSLAESLVGEVNARVKGREKFWNRPEGAEAILQLRAAVLSEDDRLARHFAQRPGNPRRRRAAA
ncbi:MAG: LysR family transcriptional regulator [Gemmataceae bacterium]|nr:LysR family transcriptional regulator [Gemmataceae bacterium]